MAEQKSRRETKRKTIGPNIRLVPFRNSDQPTVSNVTQVSRAPTFVYIDFGFLESAVLDSLSHFGRSCGKIPEALAGKLVVRIALGIDTITILHKQLGEIVGGFSARQSLSRKNPHRKKNRASRKSEN